MSIETKGCTKSQRTHFKDVACVLCAHFQHSEGILWVMLMQNVACITVNWSQGHWIIISLFKVIHPSVVVSNMKHVHMYGCMHVRASLCVCNAQMTHSSCPWTDYVSLVEDVSAFWTQIEQILWNPLAKFEQPKWVVIEACKLFHFLLLDGLDLIF